MSVPTEDSTSTLPETAPEADSDDAVISDTIPAATDSLDSNSETLDNTGSLPEPIQEISLSESGNSLSGSNPPEMNIIPPSSS